MIPLTPSFTFYRILIEIREGIIQQSEVVSCITLYVKSEYYMLREARDDASASIIAEIYCFGYIAAPPVVRTYYCSPITASIFG